MAPRLRAQALVARSEELTLLDELLAAAAAGRGSVVLVHGEAGIGKSRLLAEQVDRARAAGAPALVGRAVTGGAAFRPVADALLAHQRRDGLPPAAALGPFTGALGRLVPGWAPAAEHEAQGDLPLLVSEALLRLLRVIGAERGVVLALDDLHWADVDTLTVLDRLADAVADAPALVLLGARHAEPPGLTRLAASAGVHSLPLRRLSPAESDLLATTCAGGLALPPHVRQHVLDHAEGLPFLVEELLRGLVESGALVRTAAGWDAPAPLRASVPASFASVVRQRLSGLTPEARRVVETAAVLGRAVDWRLLVAVTHDAEAAVLESLRTAVDRGLLTHGEHDEPDVVRFVHSLAREAVLERLLPPERAELARAAAGVVEQSGQGVLAAALHAEAGDHGRAARLLLEAARAEGGALGTRQELLRRAAALAPDDLDVTFDLVEVLALAGRAAEARELGDPLLARTTPHDPRRRELALTLARACLVALQCEDAEAYLHEAAPGPATQALAAHVAFVRQRPDEAQALAESAVEADDPRVQCEALELVGRVARLHDRREDAESAFRRALQVAEQHGLPLHRVRALAELGTLDMLGPARHDRLELARELAVQTGQLWTAAMLDAQIVACHVLHMDHPASLSVAQRGVELAESLRLPALAAGCMVFIAYSQGHLGQLEQMHQTLAEAEPRLRNDPDKLILARYVRATPALMQHDLEQLRAALEQGTRMVRAQRSAAPTPFRGLHALVETVLGDGEREREELRRSGATVQAANRAALTYADAVASGRHGADPTDLLSLAEQVLEPLTWRRHHCRLLIAPAALRDGWGQPVEWLREAMPYFEDRGELGLARACREQLRLSGAPVPRRRGDALVPAHLRRLGVTVRESEVLELVAAGLSNAAVAQRLVLSPRTVETHVASLLSKTGAGSRGQLRNYVVGLP
jgi:ATP/maltotriose-dependent transcriptional regulator MalT